MSPTNEIRPADTTPAAPPAARGPLVDPTTLRARFAVRLAEIYGAEVPAYLTLVEVSAQVNARVMQARGAEAERLGSIERVTAERHGAIRVGSPTEMAQAAQVFAALGMYPTGFYDLRDAQPRPIPVISTAFRPHDRDELARNPFRVFTSMLVPQDRRFFDADLEARLTAFIGARELFCEELLDLARTAESQHGLAEEDAERFLHLAAHSFELSREPVDRDWYDELAAISGVAADIGGVGSTHINHLTPRVLDIDDLYASMSARGIEMIDEVQGPPAGDWPDVLLRQTSFRALAEKTTFRHADGSLHEGELRVRFGEVEQRGIALTPAGREFYDELVAEVDRLRAAGAAEMGEAPPRLDVAAQVWRQRLPRTEADLIAAGLAFATYAPTPEGVQRVRAGQTAPQDLPALLEGGWVEATPIVYEDFLPRSAAGIFASNLTADGRRDADQDGAERDIAWLAEAIGRPIAVPEELYEAQQTDSLTAVAAALRLTSVPSGPTAPITEEPA